MHNVKNDKEEEWYEEKILAVLLATVTVVSTVNMSSLTQTAVYADTLKTEDGFKYRIEDEDNKKSSGILMLLVFI